MLCDVLCEDILLEILSRLPVKSLIRFMCVNKYFQSLILDPCFVTMHLQKSSKRNSFMTNYFNKGKLGCFLVSSPISSLFEDPTPFFNDDIFHGSKIERDIYQVLGSCNGLVCLATWKNRKGPCMFHLYNPATKKTFTYPHSSLKLSKEEKTVMLGFGYENSMHTYKVVSIVGNLYSENGHPFRSLICSLNEESGWREIENFPADPTTVEGVGIYINNTLNWLGMPNYSDYNYDGSNISFDEVVIASLDLETETYTKILLPQELNGVMIGDFRFPCCDQFHCNEVPVLGVLSGCLSLFLQDRTAKYLSIWQMKEFGNQRSWTLFFRISFQDLGINTIPLPASFDYHHYYLRRVFMRNRQSWSHSNLLPLCMIENDRDIVITQSSFRHRRKQIIIYNLRDKKVTSKKMFDNISWIYPFDYCESLVSPVDSSRI